MNAEPSPTSGFVSEDEGSTLLVTRVARPETPAERVRGSRSWLVDEVARYGAVLEASRDRLRPRVVTLVWLYALREAGIPAKKVPQTDMVIQMPCPYDHLRPDGRSIAKVRLLVRPDGWVGVDADSECPECSGDVISRWLVTCPRCEADEDSDEHWLWDDCEVGVLYHDNVGHPRLGDDSPLAYVIEQFHLLYFAARARWQIAHPDDPETRMTVEAAHRNIEQAKPIEAAISAPPGRAAGGGDGSKRAKLPTGPTTVEETVAWLDALRDPDGKPAVPADASYRAAQSVADLHEPRPVQRLIREAQPLRRARSAKADDADRADA